MSPGTRTWVCELHGVPDASVNLLLPLHSETRKKIISIQHRAKQLDSAPLGRFCVYRQTLALELNGAATALDIVHQHASRRVQVSFALGAVKTGIPGGLLGGALFQLPGLVIMSLVGVGTASFLKDSHVWAKATTDGM